MIKVFMIRIETTHYEGDKMDELTKWEETRKELHRASREYFFNAEVTIDEIPVVQK